ncbi:ribosome recycling factor [Kurthia sibirica]|uniref:Ribosome-recycling factor n=1 Tax=Kurthia sibirica TaxID=202750 RepID=A0A2U3AQW2_9BACL|nr:ribosome recycling factor [Kurthia sibirica]PWI26927.1 ribosome recycling factor [Kurthia sibirica]GEK32531.1 ribosome-recycling factor [Kurthia sibirica]
MSKSVVDVAADKMSKTISAFTRTLGGIRAGRANASLLDRISIEYYGAPTPLTQMAGIATPEARLLVITPYDKSVLGEIEKALMKSDIGITPTNDGNVIRLAIPALTEERRKQLVKQVKKEAEEAKIGIRNVRRDANDDFKKLEKAGEITEDDLRGYSEDVQKLTDDSITKIDAVAAEKEKEILDV